ncbi:uncharacterized protein LOC130051760 isoform X2 [Ostrea edulis]|uniref:uncharacterized protein LOC130051760 isoform X2 n=1 Tax=Ostrea edulis TaxID=37623 RepID=UPI0024AEB87A|nr:uncharacterized protein LOC130051760 isoform X2 [Ostrea edulis]
MINQGLATPSKSYVIKKAKTSISTQMEVKKEMKKWKKDKKSKNTTPDKPFKKFKIRLTDDGKVGKIVHNRGRPPKFQSSDSIDLDKSLVTDEKEDERFSEKGKKKVKERDKFSAVGKAKQLLQKARTCKKDKVSPEQTTKKKVHVRKQFVLPVQSSRSSRMIIPNKRFIEEDNENSAGVVAKRPVIRVDEGAKPTGLNLLAESGLFANSSTKLQIETEKLPSLPMSSISPSGIVKPKFEALTGIGGFQSPLYDQPLIVEGKRARKPSLKVRMKLSDTSYKKFKERSIEKKLEARKIIEQEKVKQKDQDDVVEGKKLFLSPSKLSATLTSKIPTLPIMAPPKFGVAPFTSMSERERLEKLEREALVTRMRGHNILRKAKFQLNRAALNRSKADLARTLKKELKMEAKLQKIQESQKNKLTLTASGVRVDQAVGDDSSPSKYHCSICERGMTAPRRRSGVLTCESCRKFFQIYNDRIAQNKSAVLCKTGSCKIFYKERPLCQDCRYNKCLKLFNLEDQRTSASADQNSQSGGFSKEISVTIPQIIVSSASPMSSPIDSMKSHLALLSPMATSSPPASTTTSNPDTDDSPKSDGRGPRIKHVCRKAAVVLGKPVAKFPKSPEITLSALPSGEKVKLWKKDQEEKKELSDDEMPIEDIIQQSEVNIQSVKRSPVRSPLRVHRGGRYGKRKIRCKKCEGCTSEDCGVCNYCLDKPKFGGRGVMKQACIKRRCKYPRYSRLAPSALLRARDSDNQSTGSSASPFKDEFSPSLSQQGPSQEAQNDAAMVVSNRTSSLSVIQRMALQGNTLRNESRLNTEKSLAPKRPFSEVLTPEDVSRRLWQEFGYAPQRSFPKFQVSNEESTQSLNSTQPKRLITKFRGSDGRSDSMIMHSVTSARGGWSAQGMEQHRIKAEYRETFELASVWYTGVSLTVSGPMCVRTICFLCGSAGKHEMMYCNVCCEPFHEFCLEEEERPREINPDNWCCKRCQCCNVCGRQNNLLQCDKCQNTYHPECLGPNYPTKPSKKKNVWICTKCVKCKSCGATTPGAGSTATWTYDFQLCYECGQLMDKGNYCPICHKCYTDDDWDSKMVQCVSCESWVHAKCEGLSDDMYERVSFLPEDVHYVCKICSPKGLRHWELVLKDSFLDGLKSVFNTVTQAKCAQHLLHIDEKKAKELEEKLNEQKYGDVLKTTMELEKSLENFVTSLEKVLKSKSKTVGIDQHSDEKSTRKGTSVVDLVDGSEKDEKSQADKDDSLIMFEGDEDLDETKSFVNEEHQSDVEMTEILNDGDTISIADGETLSAVTTPGVSGIVTPASSAGSPKVHSQESGAVSPPPTEISEYSQEPGAVSPPPTEISEYSKERGAVSPPPTEISEYSQEPGAVSPPPTEISEDLSQRLGDVEAAPKGETMENNSNTPMLLAEEKDEVDGSKRELSLEITGNLDNQLKKQSEESQSNVCDTDNSATCPKLATEDVNTNLLDKEIKREQIEESLLATPTNVQHTINKSDEVVDLTVEKSVSFLLSTPTKGLITPQKSPSVRKTDNRFLPGFIRPYPKDFNAVKIKLINEEYSSVDEFSEDMAHIINLALNDPDEVKLVRKKATNSVRSMFVKQMEKCFPWFNVKICQIWDKNQNFPSRMLPDAVLPPFEDHTYAQWLEREELHKSPQPSPFKRVGNTPIKKIVPLPVDEDAEKVLSCDIEDSGEDIRRCILCWHYGDSDPNDAGRLLYVGQDDWVHVNCALWSAEVYEEEHDGTLQNVQTALSRGRVMRCDCCQRAGATVGCCTRGCPANYHFMCARQEHCLFQEDKKVFCPQHREKVDGELVAKEKFAVNRRVCVSMEDLKFNKKTWSKGLDPSTISVIIGSCTIEELGRLTPNSDTKDLLLPFEFSCTRVFWSTQDMRKRCVYTCRIVEVKPDSPKSVSMVIKDTTIIHDETHPDYVPLSQINIPGINLFPQTRSRRDSLEISHHSSESGLSNKSFDTSGDCKILNSSLNSSQSVRSFHIGNESLSSSWPVVKKRKKSDASVNLDVLSPNTLKLLNLKDPGKFQQLAKPCKENKEDFGTLIKIADRLNLAAGGKSDKALKFPRRERSRSADYLLSPPPVRFSPSFRSEGHQSAGNSNSNSRANSEERTFSPIPTMSLQKQLIMNKEVTTAKPLIDNNCNSQVTDFNEADVSMESVEDKLSQGQDVSLEPINEEIPEGNLTNETYIVLPEGCSELSEEDMQMIAEAIERSRSEQGTDESMISVASTEKPGGEVGGKESDTCTPSSTETGLSSKEAQENLLCTDNSEKVVSDMPESLQIDMTSERQQLKKDLAMDHEASVPLTQGDQTEDQNVNNISVSSLNDGLNSTSLVKTSAIPFTVSEEIGCRKVEFGNHSQPLQSPLSEVHQDLSTKCEASEQPLSCDESVSINKEKIDSHEGVYPGASCVKREINVGEAFTEKMDSEMAVVSSNDSSIVPGSKSNIEITPDTKVDAKVVYEVPSTSSHADHMTQQSSNINVSSIGDIVTRRGDKIPVYGREGQLIGYKKSNKSTFEHLERRRLHLLQKPTFEEVLNEAQRQIQAENEMSVGSKFEEINCSSKTQQPVFADKDTNNPSAGSTNDRQKENLDTENSLERMEHKKKCISNSISSERNVFDIMSVKEEIPKVGTSCTSESQASQFTEEFIHEKQDTEKNETEIQFTEEFIREKQDKEKNETEIQFTEEFIREKQDKEKNETEIQFTEEFIREKQDKEKNETEIQFTEEFIREKQDTEKNVIEIQFTEEFIREKQDKEKNETGIQFTEEFIREKQDTEKNKTEIHGENFIEKTESADVIKSGTQKTFRRKSSESDKDRNIFSALESSLNSSIGQEPSVTDLASEQKNQIPDTRTEKEKNDLFKGLGLARTPEAKKTKAELKKTPIKSYPLRRRSAQSGTVTDEKGSDLPLHDQIAQKIKAESLAKSSPGDKGPFKCPVCKRLYRTEESFDTHVKTCDFEVSTSDEEESENEGGTRKYSMRQTTVIKKVVMEIEQKERESESAARKERFSGGKSFYKKPKLVLRKLSPWKFEERISKLSPRKRGRPPKLEKEEKFEIFDLKGQKRLLSSDDEIGGNRNERKRRPSRNSTGSVAMSVKHIRSPMSSMFEEDLTMKKDDASTKRGRGRFKKSLVLPSEEEETKEKSEENVSDKIVSPKRGRGRPRKNCILADKEIKDEVVSDEANTKEVSTPENSPALAKGRGRRKRDSNDPECNKLAELSAGDASRVRNTRYSSGNRVCNNNEIVPPKIQKRCQDRAASKSSVGESPKTLGKKCMDGSSDKRIEPRISRKDSVQHIQNNRRPVRKKKRVNLEYPGLCSLAPKRNAILSKKLHSLKDNRIKTRKFKQALFVQRQNLVKTTDANGIKRGRGRPPKHVAQLKNKTEGVHSKEKKSERMKNDNQIVAELKRKPGSIHSKDKKNERLKSDQLIEDQQKSENSSNENIDFDENKEIKATDSEEKVKENAENSEENKVKGNGDKSNDSREKSESKRRKQKNKSEIKNTILNVIQHSNTASLLKCPVQKVQPKSESEVITIIDDEENDVIFCEKTGDFKSRRNKNQCARSCETQCDFDCDLSPPQKSDTIDMTKSSSSQSESPPKVTTVGERSSQFSNPNPSVPSLTKVGKVAETPNKDVPVTFNESTTKELMNEPKDITSTETFVDEIMNNPAIQQLTPVQLLELQNKVTEEKVDLSSTAKVDTDATIKSIKEFLRKKIEEGTNKTIYVTDTGNGKGQGQGSSEQKSSTEPLSVMKINLPSSVTPQDIQKIIEAHKRATGSLGKSESSIGITPISRSSPLQSLMSQSTTPILSSTSTFPQFCQAQLQQSNPTVQTDLVSPSQNPLTPQTLRISSQLTATNALLAAANAISSSSNPMLPSPSPVLQPPNAIMPSSNTVISQSPQNLPALNTLLNSHPTAIPQTVIPSQSAILPVRQQFPMISPSAIFPSQQTPLVSGGIQEPVYSVSNSTPRYQAISPAIMTVPEPQKTYLLPPNQNLITVPQSQNILPVAQNPNISPQIDSYMLSLINNSALRVSQGLLNTDVSQVMNNTQYVQSVPQVQSISSLQNVPQVIQNMGLQTDTQQFVQNQSLTQTQGPAIKSLPIRDQTQPFINQNTSLVASNAMPYPTPPPANPTIVRVFVDGKPIAMTTDASVLSDPTAFLAKLDPTALQKGRYNMSVTSHRVTSTTTLTVSTKGNNATYRAHCSPTTANKVLSALLKNRANVESETMLTTSLLTKSPRGRPAKSATSSQKKTIFRKLTKVPTSMNTATSSTVTVSSSPPVSASSMAIKAAPHTRLPPAMAQNRSLLPASVGEPQAESLQSREKSMALDKFVGASETVDKPYIVRKPDGTVVKRVIKSASKYEQEKNFAIQPKVMRAIMKKLGGDKPVPILGKHYEMLSVRVKSKAAVKVKEKRKQHRKSPQKVRLGLPQASGTLSHPIIHPHKELMTLPQPAMEEEVEETPLSQFQQEQREKQLGRYKKDGPKFQFQITSDDGFSCKGDSMSDVWQQVVEKVQDVRSSARMKNLSFTNLDPARLFGVSYNPVVYLLEQLFGAQNCRHYNFRYHQYDIADLEEEPAENPSGCIRSEPYETRKPFDIFSFLMSQYRHMPGTNDSKSDVEMVHKSARRATSMDLPMAMRFRKLKEHAREAVGVYRSSIHGRGLFCKRNIDEGEMVIEYSGEVIRASLTDKREKYYEGKGIGCYMFRIDDYDVIDATLHGSAARFINHSCEPNCYSKVINVDGKKHIVIFAMTSIKRGEELTYDYKFPIEEVKIPCTCGAKKCRKYLN